MNPPPGITPEVRSLIEAACDGMAHDAEMLELQSILRNSEEACSFYVDLLNLDADLQWLMGGREDGSAPLTDTSTTVRTSAQHSAFLSLSAPVQNSFTCLSSGWPVAYLIATVIFGIGALIGTLITVPHPTRSALEPLPVAQNAAKRESENRVVGRITATVGCKWAKADPIARNVDLGTTYELVSGLVEITYNSGAKVILQGPATYEVESANSGRLSFGKLTGRVEVEEAKGFVVRTPNAVITDLGTEFAVEVDEQGNSRSHVFRGSVRLQIVSSDGTAKDAGRVLHANESAAVRVVDGRPTISMLPAAAPSEFVRKLPPRQAIKVLDLVDVVAGGDGFSNRRNRGIDPRTGRRSDSINVPRPNYTSDYFVGDRTYHRAEGFPLVDGVFIPDGSAGPVQVDSAGDVFEGFGPTANLTANEIWAMPPKPGVSPKTMLHGVEYGSPRHALLFLHANNGITFDLNAVRQANPGCKLLRFCATVANTETGYEKNETVSSDLWVLIDGKTRFRRRELNSFSGAIPVLVPLDQGDRFLTLAATDGGNGINFDWILFGDARLELISPQEETR